TAGTWVVGWWARAGTWGSPNAGAWSTPSPAVASTPTSSTPLPASTARAAGGTLRSTHRGRTESALAGGRITTAFIDNSAGVDTSDHEVNWKILLGLAIARGELPLQERNRLLVGG